VITTAGRGDAGLGSLGLPPEVLFVVQHRAIREAIAAGSASGARLLAREHVLSSGRLIEAVIESIGGAGRDPGWGV
jgi:DNA-binding GntR family transcriptional regulator